MMVDVQNFEQEVISASHTVPILVDFWAEWCGPCRVLGPVLERLSEQSGGRWRLAKVNTEEHPEVSASYGIRGIPNVKLFVDGEVVDEFTGALPEPAVREWLERVLPSPARKQVEEAAALLDQGEHAAAAALLEEALASDAGNAEIRILLARAIVFKQPDRAQALVADQYTLEAEAVKSLTRLLQLGEQPDLLPEADIKQDYLSAIRALAARNFDAALQQFIAVVRQDRSYDADGARKACVALFTFLGPGHEVTRKHRRTFDMALY